MKLSPIFKSKKFIISFAAAVVLFTAIAAALLYLAYIPKRFSEHVAEYAEEYGVEEDLAYAVIRAESGFRSDAVSSAGARGLMQLMPPTAQFISESIGVSLNIDSPRDNIRMGIWYIAYLQKRFFGITEVLAAYNAGEGAVRRWLKDARFSADGDTLSGIPVAETASYVRKVKKFYNYYKFFY